MDADGLVADAQQRADFALDTAIDRAAGRRADKDEVLHIGFPLDVGFPLAYSLSDALLGRFCSAMPKAGSPK